jgi:hypothetical protein
MVTCLLLPLPLPLALLTSPSPYSEVYIHQSIWPQHTFNESSLLGLGFGPSSLEWFGEVLEMTTSSSLSSCGHPWTRVVMVGPSYDGSCHLALTFGFSFMGGLRVAMVMLSQALALPDNRILLADLHATLTCTTPHARHRGIK